MNFKTFSLLLIMAAAMLFFFNRPDEKEPFQNIRPGELKELMQSYQNEITIIDVRTPGEWEAGSISESLKINLYDDDFAEKISELDPNNRYLIYCNSGGRSRVASGILTEAGFLNVINYQGRFTDIIKEYEALKEAEE